MAAVNTFCEDFMAAHDAAVASALALDGALDRRFLVTWMLGASVSFLC
jgi:hypothetical protein